MTEITLALDYLAERSWIIEFYLKIIKIFVKIIAPLVKGASAFIKKVFSKVIEVQYEDYFFRIVENTPYALLILFLGLIGVFTLTKLTEEKNGVRISTITTSSMAPAINPGSIIVSVPQKNYKIGDVITYKEENLKTGVATGRALAHRIIEAKNTNGQTSFITQGDGNDTPDPGEIDKTQILGKVIVVVPNIGYLDLIIKTIPGFIIFIMIPSLILIKNELTFIREERNFYR